MGYGFAVDIRGDYALFSRPELKTERYSYDVITPSAARGILESVFWKPAIRYVIDRIYVLNPIIFTNIRRNEVSEKLSCDKALTAMNNGSGNLYLASTTKIMQRASTLLKDVHYVVEAHFELTDKAGLEDSAEKFYAMILRRLRKGQCFNQPYLGCREFTAQVRLYEEDSKDLQPSYENQNRDFGLMLYDMDFSQDGNIKPMFYRAQMEKGCIDLRNCEVLR